ncbi:MAG: hypothetical protein Q4E67_04880 [Planctomycetia bacterium]|nr:hypothetical protein [Planctomycetia bacterium]
MKRWIWQGWMIGIFLVGTWITLGAGEAILPEGRAPKPLECTAFPNKVCAVVWRNWNLVEVETLAEVLRTTPEEVTRLAESLGLPPYCKPPWKTSQIYITLLRRNWHLLPYEQLLTLVDMSAEKLAFHLQEDDFLFIKLGSLKPKCEPVHFSPLAPQELGEVQKWREMVETLLGGKMTSDTVPRLAFVEDLTQTDASVPQEKDVPSRFQIRYAYSYFAMFGDPLADDDTVLYPDGLLQKLRQAGANGVWLHVVLRDLAPGGIFPEWGAGHEKRIANLRKLVERAEQFGIRIYLYINEPRAVEADFFNIPGRETMKGVQRGSHYSLCTSNPAVRQWLSDSLAYLFREVPGLGGIFTITASENQTNCASHGLQAQCPRCSKRDYAEILAEVNAAMEEGVHRSAPDAKVLVWDWGWHGHGLATDVIAKLPKNVWLMTVSEWGLPIERGGIPAKVGEYSLSAVGPGPRAVQHWEAARQAGLKTAAKVQLGTSWEIASVPYVPALDLVARHCHRLASSGVDGLMLGWSLGGYPSPNLSLPRYFDRTPLPSVEEVLNEMARLRFGEGAAQARAGWTQVSTAYEEYPFHISVVYTAPIQMGPANPLYLHPTGYRATMVGISYDDLNAWRGVYPPEVWIAQFRKVSRGMLTGAALLKEAALAADVSQRSEGEKDARYAEVVGLHAASVANQAEFILLRDAWQKSESQKELVLRMIELLQDEIRLARQELALVQQDATIGFESTNHYWFVSQDLVEKMVSCQKMIAELEATLQ